MRRRLLPFASQALAIAGLLATAGLAPGGLSALARPLGLATLLVVAAVGWVGARAAAPIWAAALAAGAVGVLAHAGAFLVAAAAGWWRAKGVPAEWLGALATGYLAAAAGYSLAAGAGGAVAARMIRRSGGAPPSP
jgi:hypothetical protein